MFNRPALHGSTDYAKEKQIIARNALLYHLTVFNKSGSTIYVQVHDLAAGTGTSAAPVFEVAVPTLSVLAFPFPENGWQFANGIYVRAVTAAAGSTLIAASDAKFTYQYDGPWPRS